LTAKQAPGPRGFSVVSSIIGMRGTDPLTFWCGAHAKYGDTIKLGLGPMDIWAFASPKAIYEVLVTQNRNMRKGLGYAGLKKLLGEGLITTDKDHWATQRHRLNPLFAPTAIDAYSRSIYDAVAAGLEEINFLASEGAPVDIGHTMTRLTMRVISRAAFGVDLTTGHDDIVDAFEFAFAFVADITSDPLSAPLIIPTSNNRKFKHSLQKIDSFIDLLIDQSKAQPDASNMNAKIFTALKGNDRKQLRDEIISLYFAGFETTARTMTFLMYLLPRYPNVLKDLRSEADTLQKPDNRNSMINDLPFATEVVNEALRLFPPVAMMARQANSDCQIDGYEIRANSMLIICPFIAQRDKEYWPAEDKFSPSVERPMARQLLHRGAFATFGAGPRVCLGKHFAMVEMSTAISMIAQAFDWTLESDAPVELDFHGTLRPSKPILARLTARKHKPI